MHWWLVSLIPDCPSSCWEVDGPFRSPTDAAEFADRHRRRRDRTIIRASGRIRAIEAAIRLRHRESAAGLSAGTNRFRAGVPL